MSREWEPGDVAMIEVGCRANRHVGMFVGGGWHYSDKWVANDPAIVTARPLVVIDPEDREQVERLWRTWVTLAPDNRLAQDNLQAALREFASPTPPRPDEPQGLGAVVEDADGVKYVRAGITHDGAMEDCWRHVTGSNIGYWSKYSNIAAVRVLSEGVTP